ncbi:MAG: hypothetical protein CBC48_14210 [bacterium TMED88]|nr:MAG: hypothetical protein CBC48_14210 [bacterium TMED88]
MSDSDILAQINAQPGKMGDGGIGGNLYKRISAGASVGDIGDDSEGDYTGGTVGRGAGAYNPPNVNFNSAPNVNFNPGGIDMGGDVNGGWSNEDFIRGLAKERAEAYTDGTTSNPNQSVVNNITQKIGNKGDRKTKIGDNNTFNGVSLANDYSLNLGNINVANKQNQFAA